MKIALQVLTKLIQKQAGAEQMRKHPNPSDFLQDTSQPRTARHVSGLDSLCIGLNLKGLIIMIIGKMINLCHQVATLLDVLKLSVL